MLVRTAAAILMLLTTAGCLELQQELRITGPNRGSFRLQASLPAADQQALWQPGAGALQPYARFFDIDAGSAWFAEQPGIKLRQYRVFERDGRRFLQVEGDLTDLRAALASGALGHFRLSERPDGHKVLRLELPAAPERTPEQLATLRQATHGLRLDLTVQVDGRLVDTTAPDRQGKRARWTFAPDRDPAFLAEPPTVEVVYAD